MATLAEEKMTLAFRSSEVLVGGKPNAKIVAEGDSWFDYPLVRDIIDHLRRMGYGVEKHSKHGDTLENMVYGTIIDGPDTRPKNPGPVSLLSTLQAIKLYK